MSGNTTNYTCSYCGTYVAGTVVASNIVKSIQWLSCPHCEWGSVSNKGMVVPAPLLGEYIKGLPETIQNAYVEARKSFSSKSYTACVLMCRKILMNVAVKKNAPEGDTFTSYIDYMINKGYITVTMKEWVDKIRKNGNDATHEIPPPDSEKACTTLEFTALLLKNVYETKFLLDPKNKLRE